MQQTHTKIPKNHFEKIAWVENLPVIGIDEVGRGCLAGPLVTAAVMLPPYKTHKFLKDSKILNQKEREIAYAWIIKNCLYSVGIVHHRIIDQHNLWYATLIAMKKAAVHLLTTAPLRPHAVLVDAMPLNLANTSFDDIPIHYFPFGEQRSSSIAAASIVAKVRRDALLRRLDPIFPGYTLANHKGYRTPGHKKALDESQSHLIIHRINFLNTYQSKKGDYDKQQTFC